MSDQKHAWTGQTVAGRYLLGKYLGGTDHGKVFSTEIVHARAVHVAIKLIPESKMQGANRQLSRWREFVGISGSTLLKIHDCGSCELDGQTHLFVVQEFADEDLGDILPERALSAEETRGMIEPVIETLALLHGQNLVHTRLHPGNILAIGDQIKLANDSITPKGESSGLTSPVEGFSAPEWGTVPADPATDIWSLGATIITALSQKIPAFGEHHGGLLLPEEVKEPFARIARECLNKEPAQRPSIAKVRSLLNAPITPVAKEVPKEIVKEAAKVPPRIEPVAAPVAKPAPAPPPVPVMRAPVASVSRVRPTQAKAKEKKSYVLPIAVIAIVAVLFLAIPRLFRQQSDAATSVSKTGSEPTSRASTPKAASGPSKQATEKGSPSKTALTEASQPVTPAPASVVKTLNKPSHDSSAKGDVLDQVLPDISDKARATIQGRVRLDVKLEVNPTGTVDSAEISGPVNSKYFSDQAIKAAKRWQFSAPELDGHSVASRWLIHFEFTPTATNVRPAQVSP
ncbi:MAG: TonB family protein [Acidobacteria bacterium]|nr:TonB family protein [Acidobacteriota bacterium]MBS1864363.1 TonB family protein [Acidobacteriota bacterium]